MNSSEQFRVALVAHAAVDMFLEESSTKRFRRYRPEMTIDQVLATNRDVEDGENRGSVYRRLGGPVLTIGQYLAAKHPETGCPFEVSAVTVLGTDSFSQRYEEALRTLGISLYPVSKYKYDGTISRCAYVYPKGNPTIHLPPFWEDGVSAHFDEIQVPPNFLADQNMLILPITPPSVAKRTAVAYRDANPQGILVYNPGFYLLDPTMSFADTGFSDIMQRTNILVLNRDEREVVRRNGVNRILDLFHEFPSLNVLVSTKDREGSVIHVRAEKTRVGGDTHLHHSSLKGKPNVQIETPVGAGDAFIGAFLRYYIGRNYDLVDAHERAEEKAERQLGIKGGVDPFILTSGDFPREPGAGILRLAK